MRQKTKKVIKLGLLWGIVMFSIMELILPLIQNEPLILKNSLTGLAIWLIAGLLLEMLIISVEETRQKS